MRRSAQLFFCLVVVFVQGCATTQPTYSPTEKTLDRGQYRLAGRCSGSSGPLVVLESPSGLAAEAAFANVLPALSQRARVCYLDRVGLGQSSAVPNGLLQTTRDYANDLQAFLNNVAPNEKAIMIGYSFGGLVARYFAAVYPNRVTGLLLLDPAHENWLQNAKQQMQADDWQKVQNILDWFKAKQGHDYWNSQFEVANTQLVPSLPVRIISRGLPFQRIRQAGISDQAFQIYNNTHNEQQQQMATLTTRTHQTIAQRSEHFIVETEPELVLQEFDALMSDVQRQ